MAMSMRTTAASGRAFLGRRIAAPKNVARVTMKAGNWLPGSEAPAWLRDDLAGNFGFDPLKLGENAGHLQRYSEAELQNGRWAMLGAAGVIAVELFGYGDWVEAQAWVTSGGNATWFGITNPLDIATLVGIQFIGFAIAEGKRNEETDPVKRRYPGGAFDPLGFSKDPKAFETYKLKEVKNGRLAMLAMLGFFAQYSATGKGPLENLSDHLGAPWSANFATNGVSLPF